MNFWLSFAIIAQFLNAIVVLIDRHVVTSKVVLKPIVYTFYVSLLSIWAIIVIPFGVTLPGEKAIVLCFIASVSYILSIYFLYESLKDSSPLEIVPVVGSIAALSAFATSSTILDIGLPSHFFSGFFVLVIGMILISHFRFNLRSFLFLIFSGFFFGFSTVMIKLIFNYETFINGFFWSRITNVFIALIILLVPGIYNLIQKDLNRPTNRYNRAMFIMGNKVLAGIAFFLVIIAIKFSDVSLVNALTATQYIFLLIFALFFSKLLPEYLSEIVHKHELIHKIFATGLIVFGFIILFVA